MNRFVEDKADTTGLKWWDKRANYYGSRVNLKEVDDFIDKVATENNNHFEVFPDLYFTIDNFSCFNGDNVEMDVTFSREFSRDRDENDKSEYNKIEDLFNNGFLDKWFHDADVGGTGWNERTGTPRWAIHLYDFSDYNNKRKSEGHWKRPNNMDWHTMNSSTNGTEPFTRAEGKEINQHILEVVSKIVEDNWKTASVKNGRANQVYWNGSYAHHSGWFAIEFQVRDTNTWRDEWKLGKMLKEKCPEALNEYLADYNLEIIPDSCSASWYEGSNEDSETSTYEVEVGFKEKDIESPYDTYMASTGNSLKEFPWYEDEPEMERTFPKRPQKKASMDESMNKIYAAVLREAKPFTVALM